MELLVAAAIAVSLGGGFWASHAASRATSLTLTRPVEASFAAPAGQDARPLRWHDTTTQHPGHGVTPAKVISAFTQAEMGDPSTQCDMIDDLIEGDCTLRNLFEQRQQSVAGKPWVMQADGAEGDSELGARVLGLLLKRLPMIEVFEHLLTFNRYGYAAVEIDWGIVTVEGRLWIAPVWLTPVPARRFKVGADDQLLLYADVTRPQGDPLRPDKWIVMRRAGSKLVRAGLMRTAAGPAIGKRFGFRDWLIYSQRFGLPLPIVSYEDENDDDEIDLAEQIVRKIGSDGGAVKPKSLELEFHDATRGNQENSKAHGGLISYCNAEMSKLVNGSTLTNDSAGSGGASYALGEVHATVTWDNVQYDAERLHEAIRNQLSEPFMRFNALGGAPSLLKVQVVRDLDPKTRSEVADVFQNKLGIKVSQSQMRQEAGFREPISDADAAPGPTPQPMAPGAPA